MMMMVVGKKRERIVALKMLNQTQFKLRQLNPIHATPVN